MTLTKFFVIIPDTVTSDMLTRDVRLALRLLRRSPAFTLAAMLTLALGIGGSTAVFSVLHAVLLRPLPYPDADRLVQFRIEHDTPAGRFAFEALPAEQALEWKDQSAALADLALFNDRALTLSTPNGPHRLIGVAGTPNIFDVVGVAPLYGGTFDAASRDRTQIVLSYATWQRFFAGQPAAVGTTAMLDGTSYTIIGVMPREFAFPTLDAEFWVPLIADRAGTRGMLLPAVARLTPGATTAAVVAEGERALGAIGVRETRTLIVRSMQDQLVGGVRRLLWVLMAAVGFVFAIALGNTALLLLTRGAAREREFSLRLALGAGRAGLVRQLTIEGLVLAVAGGAAGVLLAALGAQALVALAPPDMPRLRDVALERTTLAFSIASIVVTGIGVGILSSWRALAADPVGTLGRLGGDGQGGLPRAARRRLDLLAASGLAFTVLLLVGAGLLLRSFAAVLSVDQGFEADNAIAVQVSLPSSRYPSADARLAFHERLLERLQAMPGIASAGLATAMPNRQPSGRFSFAAVELPLSNDPMSRPVSEIRMVTDGFLEAMGLRLRTGRTFRREDADGTEPVIVISDHLAREQFPNGGAVGAMLYSESGDRRVVGVVSDVKPATTGRPIAP